MTLVSTCSRGLFAVWKPPSLGSAQVTLELRKILQGGNLSLKLDQVFNVGKIIKKSENSDFSFGRRTTWVKVGHGGTLDRSAEGVLVIGVGRDCKLLDNYLLKKDKEYVFTGELGKMTDTLDGCGILIKEAPWNHITQADLEEALKQFQGDILQAPPIFSALKVNGQRLSDLAYKARSASRPSLLPPKARPVTIKLLQLLKFEPPHFTLSVLCSSGTYMRSLARDVGYSLGTVCYVTSLTRTGQGVFTRKTALREEDWTAENIRTAIEDSKRLLSQTENVT